MNVQSFIQELRIQRWDDHRFYHQSRINQSLHFISAVSFLVAYVMLFINPAVAGLIGWLVSMTSRQAGHFFFEPRTFDQVNNVTHEHKEEIKVGYNLQRKVVLLTIWILLPALIALDSTLFGLLDPVSGIGGVIERTGLAWLFLGVGALAFRTIHLFFLRDIPTGLVWCTKILTDPFNDIRLYHAAPLKLLRGELMDPMEHVAIAHEQAAWFRQP